MKFKNYLNEIEDDSNVDIADPLSKIKIILSSMSDDELNEFGEWLEDNIDSEEKDMDIDTLSLDDQDDLDDIDDIDNDAVEEFSLNDIIEIIQSLPSNDLEYVLYMLQDQVDQVDVDNAVPDTTINNESISAHLEKLFSGILDEQVVARFKAANRNHAKKRFQLSRSKLRAGKAKRKIDNIKNRAKRKAYYRKNKVKLKKYDKSYNNAVKSGQHKKKIRI